MKTPIIVLTAMLVIGIKAVAADFKPAESPNPWPDDYTAVATPDSMAAWGPYNLHDPSCILADDGCYYMYSTDAIYLRPGEGHRDRRWPVKPGNIPVRRSRDLVNWEFMGWAFDSIPDEGREWVRSLNDGHGAGNIWAPYITRRGDKYRLYYCVSAFGKNTSWIGLAEAGSPLGPWEQRGCVVKTDRASAMNAIDPSVIHTSDGREWMHYGSYFGGLYCVELDPETGLALTPGDQGHLTARRANWRVDNLEAPEIYYNRDNGRYYLFGSYEPLMTTYNVRVCRSDTPEGPFVDFHGYEMKDTTNNFPILTSPYAFDGHQGWAGTGHCGVFEAGDGRVYMVHQGRLSPGNQLMVMHLREMFFTPSGWPVVSPERYAGTPTRRFKAEDLAGEWELIRVEDPRSDRGLEAGQVLWGEGDVRRDEVNRSTTVNFGSDGTVVMGNDKGSWDFAYEGQLLDIILPSESIRELVVHAGHDWERETDTVLLTGLDSRGRSVWAKRIK